MLCNGRITRQRKERGHLRQGEVTEPRTRVSPAHLDQERSAIWLNLIADLSFCLTFQIVFKEIS
jgi:hypothetical protein